MTHARVVGLLVNVLGEAWKRAVTHLKLPTGSDGIGFFEKKSNGFWEILSQIHLKYGKKIDG